MESNQTRLGGSHLVSVIDENGEPVDIVDHKIEYESGGVETYELKVVAPAGGGEDADDLTTIDKIGDVAETWLNSYGISTYAALANISGAAAGHMATDPAKPRVVDTDRIREWVASARALVA